jgi:hypothetical protein
VSTGVVVLDPKLVHDEASFLVFVSALVDDRRLATAADRSPYDSPRGWENDTIEDFFESALRWSQDSNFGRNQGLTDETNPWQRIAIFLYCGKIYE